VIYKSREFEGTEMTTKNQIPRALVQLLGNYGDGDLPWGDIHPALLNFGEYEDTARNHTPWDRLLVPRLCKGYMKWLAPMELPIAEPEPDGYSTTEVFRALITTIEPLHRVHQAWYLEVVCHHIGDMVFWLRHYNNPNPNATHNNEELDNAFVNMMREVMEGYGVMEW
jgi:hypothetical protein